MDSQVLTKQDESSLPSCAHVPSPLGHLLTLYIGILITKGMRLTYLSSPPGRKNRSELLS